MKVCDLRYLKSISPDNPKFVTEMIEIFLRNVPVAIESMKNGLLTEDWEALQHHAHKLRSHIDCMGISLKYKEMAKQIEENAVQQSQLDVINQMVPQLDEVFNRAYAELREELKKIKQI